jgi:cytochrome c oxidase subunit IV
MSDVSIEEMKKHIKLYWLIFGGLLFLTLVTVGVSYLDLSIGPAIALAMFVASIKGSLVALFFMHLSHEKTIIYATLIITAAAFLICMLIPIFVWG